MTREQKDLLIKDLCSRLSYGVKCKILETNEVKILGSIQYDGENTLFDFWKDDQKVQYEHQLYLSEFKPYLFPLSSMKVSQKCKVQNLLPDNCEISFKNQKITFYNEGNIKLEQLEKIFNLFNLFHIDYRGLIPEGLAIDATGLNIY